MASVLLASAARAEADPGAGARERSIALMRGWTHLPARSVVAVTPEMVVALLERGDTDAGAGHINGVELQGEVVDEGFAQARGWRSMRLRVDIACADGATQVRRMTVYAGHDHAGAAHEAIVPKGWVQPKPGAFLGEVVGVLCGPTPASEGLAEATAPSAPATPSASPTPVPAAKAAPSGAFVAQLAAAADEAGARQALGPAAMRLIATTPGAAFRVEPAMVAGRQVYRAIVAGFADLTAARGFCATLRKAGEACFVR